MRNYLSIIILTFANSLFAQNFQWGIGGLGDTKASTIDSLGNVYLVGSFYGSVDFDPGTPTIAFNSAGQNDIFIAKYDSNGYFKWAKAFGSTGEDEAKAVCIDKKGNLFVTGFFTGTVDFDPSSATTKLASAGSSDIFVAKYTNDGNYVWAKKLGGATNDEGYGIGIDKNGGLYHGGYFTGDITFSSTKSATSKGSSDMFISKLDTNGVFVWAVTFGASNPDEVRSMTVDYTTGAVYTTGIFDKTIDFDPGSSLNALTSNANFSDGFVLKLTKNGAFSWVYQIENTNTVIPNALTLDANGNVLVTGGFDGLITLPNNGILSSIGNFNVFILKLSVDGNYTWIKEIGGGDSDEGITIATDQNRDIYIGGSFYGNVDFDPGAGTTKLSAPYSNNADAFLLKLSKTGDFAWVKQLKTISKAKALQIMDNGSLYWAGYSYASIYDIDPNDGVTEIKGGGYLLKLAPYQQVLGFEHEAEISLNGLLYPNPTSETLHLNFISHSGKTYKVVDSYGSVVQSGILLTQTIDVSKLPKGVYTLNVDNKYIKFLKE